MSAMMLLIGEYIQMGRERRLKTEGEGCIRREKSRLKEPIKSDVQAAAHKLVQAQEQEKEETRRDLPKGSPAPLAKKRKKVVFIMADCYGTHDAA